MIGGSRDGEVHPINNQQPIYRVVKRNTPPLILQPTFNPQPVETETYHRKLIRGDKYVFVVFVHESLTEDDMIEALIRSYKKPKGEPILAALPYRFKSS